MDNLIKAVRDSLVNIVNDIDTGNSNLSDEQCIAALQGLGALSRKDIPMSKYQAYQYLGISRATFDNYVREGKIPKGKHTAGYKELSWYKKDLDKFIKSIKNDNNKVRK